MAAQQTRAKREDPSAHTPRKARGKQSRYPTSGKYDCSGSQGRVQIHRPIWDRLEVCRRVLTFEFRAGDNVMIVPELVEMQSRPLFVFPFAYFVYFVVPSPDQK